jgi:hypothetical protein
MMASWVIPGARILVLVGLLLAAEPPQRAILRAFHDLPQQQPWDAWLLLVLIVFGFVVVALAGRREDDAGMLVGLEGIVAALVGFLPPWQWVAWFGLGAIPRVLTGGFAGSLLTQVLGVAWFAIVLMTAVRRWRRPRMSAAVEHDPEPPRRAG